VLDHLGVAHELAARWQGEKPGRGARR